MKNNKKKHLLKSGKIKLLPFLVVLCLISAGPFLLGVSVGATQPTPAEGQLKALIEDYSDIDFEMPDLEISSDFIQVDLQNMEGIIRRGDTISKILAGHLNGDEIKKVSRASRKVYRLSRIVAGQRYKTFLNNGNFQRFEYDINSDEMLVISKDDQGKFKVFREDIEYAYIPETITGSVVSNLADSISQNGGNGDVTAKLVDIFAWDIDFIRDTRKGDKYNIVIERRFRDGKVNGFGNILAAEYVNNSDSHKAFLYQDGKKNPDYYDENGESLRKAFLKSPVSYSRISSGYSMRRFHPITKTWKAHPAIDYAAPPGTPIKAVADGKITRIGKTHGNGNFIEIKHKNGYRSLYLHMKKFGQGMKWNKNVDQGTIIGYVGSTGLATGPHLCFRMTKDKKPINPTKIASAAAEPVSNKNKEKFLENIGNYIALFETQSDPTIKLAKTQQNNKTNSQL